MTDDDRYRCVEHPDGGAVIYDREDGGAWIHSSYAVEVPNRKVGRNPGERGQTGRAGGGDGDRWASDSAHSGTRVSTAEDSEMNDSGYTDAEEQ